MSDQLQSVRLQNLRDFTVQIRHASTGAVIGVGIAISMEGQIVTCSHILRAAGIDEQVTGDAEVGVYFPQARDGEVKARRATYVGSFPGYGDLVALQLIDGPAPLAPEQIAVLGTADESLSHQFISYGFRPLEPTAAVYIRGTILEAIERPGAAQPLADGPAQLEPSQIDLDISGAAVLDTERNLVVGLISEARPIDQAAIGDAPAPAANARVLTFPPSALPLRSTPLEKRPAPQPRTNAEAARVAVAPNLGMALESAPPPLQEWVGRTELIRDLTGNWADPTKRVIALVGRGGQGKSSLARRWLDNLLTNPIQPQPDGVFWWTFRDRPNVDEFFEAVLNYMGGGRIDPRRLPSSYTRAQVLGAMLGAGYYLYVLDGLEVLQHQEGDQYGLLTSADLRAFLEFCATPGHQSVCLVTSRVPVLDLLVYPSYTQYDVDPLTLAEGRALLRGLDISGPDLTLDQLVEDWDGHPLALRLLAAYLREHHHGEADVIDTIESPPPDRQRRKHVDQLLRHYDEHLTEAERFVLMLFSAFRTPIAEAAIPQVFQAADGDSFNMLIADLDDNKFAALLRRLVEARVLRYDPEARHYIIHPLVRDHYQDQLYGGSLKIARAIHTRIKEYYLALAGETSRNPTLQDLAPLIEVIHHACRAGAYDQALGVLWERIYRGGRWVIIHQLGAYDTVLSLMLEFFRDGNISQEPQLSDPDHKRFILNTVGFCLMNLGRLAEAALFYERAVAGFRADEDWHNASVGYHTLTELYAHLGQLDASAEAAREALTLARRMANKRYELISLVALAWIDHLHGDLAQAGTTFEQAEALGRELDRTKYYLYGPHGIRHAEHLRRTGELVYARQVTEANLEICKRHRWTTDLSRCYRLLGDLEAMTGQHERARSHYDDALKAARDIVDRTVLIEALLARGRWAARQGESAAARGDLDEALAYAIAGGYSLYETDIRVGLAWAGQGVADSGAADEAEYARYRSAKMGYYWGQVEAMPAE